MSGIRETILFSRATIFVALVAAATRAEEAVTLDGLADVFYLYNFNKPATGRGELRAYDGPHNCFHLNLAELSLEKRPAAGHRIGFRVDLDYGTTPRVNNAAEPAGMRRLQSAGQAYLSYLAPIGSGLRLDAGKFYTPIGNEVVRTSNNWNYSRSLLFTLAEPTYHAGIRASYTVNERVALSAHFVNGWNNVGDNNGAKSVGLQATLTPVPALSIVQTYVGGPEQSRDDRDWRHLADTVITVTATPRLTLAANYDYGRDSLAGARVKWQGVAGYIRYRANNRLAVSSRWEWYDDHNGFTSGTPQRIKESTLTGEWKARKNSLLRVEVRRDSSSRAGFLKKVTEHVDHQDTLTLAVIVGFTHEMRKP